LGGSVPCAPQHGDVARHAKGLAMFALGILLLVIGPLFLLTPHQMARLGRPSSRTGRERYEQGLRKRGVPLGRDEESEVSRVRERVAGLVLTVIGLLLLFLG
jgi:hypothetical protein